MGLTWPLKERSCRWGRGWTRYRRLDCALRHKIIATFYISSVSFQNFFFSLVKIKDSALFLCNKTKQFRNDEAMKWSISLYILDFTKQYWIQISRTLLYCEVGWTSWKSISLLFVTSKFASCWNKDARSRYALPLFTSILGCQSILSLEQEPLHRSRAP